MKYKFKSGVVFKRICESVVNQLKKGDTLVYECETVDLYITLNNGFIYGSIVSTSLTGLTQYEISYLEKSMMLNGYFGNGTYKTLKGFLQTYVKNEKNAVKKIENGEHLNKDIHDKDYWHTQTTQETHNTYRNTQKKIVLVDLIYLALHELEAITNATKWIGNEFYLMPDLEKSNFAFAWRNFWFRCFIKDFLNGCKVQVGFLNHKLNREIKQNECVTSYAEYLFYLKNKVKQDYQSLKEV